MTKRKTLRERAIQHADGEAKFWNTQNNRINPDWIRHKDSYIAGYRAARRSKP
jgi:hypothetical protein